MKLSRRVRELSESPTLHLTARAARMRAAGHDVVSLTAGEPDFPTPEVVTEAGIDALRQGWTKYSTPAFGLPEVRDAVRRDLRARQGVDYDPAQVILTVGAKMALNLALHALVEPGDEVLIPTPYWVSYPALAQLAGATPVFVEGRETNGFKLTPDDVRARLTEHTRVFIYNSPSNPGGFYYTPDQTRALIEALVEYDLTILSDEIYDRLVFGDDRTLSPAAVSDHAHAKTLTVNGGSKAFSMTGWRIGYGAGPTDLIDAMKKLQSQGTSGAPPFVQKAFAKGLDEAHEAVEEMRQAFARRGRHVHERLRAMRDVTCVAPTSAFYAFPNVSASFARLGVSGSAEFGERLLMEAGLALIPGVAFGSDAHVRLSFATSMDEIDKGLDRLETFLK